LVSVLWGLASIGEVEVLVDVVDLNFVDLVAVFTEPWHYDRLDLRG